MSPASPRTDAQRDERIERLQPWIGALLSALLHALMVWVLLNSSPPVVSTPESAASGGRTRVQFVGRPPPPTPDPPTPERKPALRPTPLASSAPVRPLVDPDRILLPAEPTPPQPPRPLEPTPPRQAQAPATPPSQPPERRPETWTGRAPGMIDREVARHDEGQSDLPSDNGRRARLPGNTTSMDIGGYQVVYDLVSEDRLREWMDQGIKELSIPLPGTRYWMVCPAEVAMRRGSGKCRLLDPNSPEMDGIGDARKVITVMRVYKQGELAWSGPGPYR